ncbi:hypothetical protein NF681_11235 [Comamonadaceae bacterium OTU4NAUVB1]|nr:hypothetical protein NF681_11235 [Comamonadaceae bacterium OTU4NAUVB1]
MTTLTPAPEVIWECKIGGPVPGTMPDGWDFLMRHAVKDAFHLVAGVDAEFTFSGRGQLTEMERAVVEKRAPVPAASKAATLPPFDPTDAMVNAMVRELLAGPRYEFWEDRATAAWKAGYRAALASQEAAQPTSPGPLTAEQFTEIMRLHDEAAIARRDLKVGGNVPKDEADKSRATRRRLYECLAALASPQVAPTQAAEDARDAARYRKLRSITCTPLAVIEISGTTENDWDVLTEETLDIAVDALPEPTQGEQA